MKNNIRITLALLLVSGFSVNVFPQDEQQPTLAEVVMVPAVDEVAPVNASSDVVQMQPAPTKKLSINDICIANSAHPGCQKIAHIAYAACVEMLKAQEENATQVIIKEFGFTQEQAAKELAELREFIDLTMAHLRAKSEPVTQRPTFETQTIADGSSETIVSRQVQPTTLKEVVEAKPVDEAKNN